MQLPTHKSLVQKKMTADGDVMPLAQFLAEFGEPLMAQINRQTPVVYDGRHDNWQDDVLAGLKTAAVPRAETPHPRLLRRTGHARPASGIPQWRNGHRQNPDGHLRFGADAA